MLFREKTYFLSKLSKAPSIEKVSRERWGRLKKRRVSGWEFGVRCCVVDWLGCLWPVQCMCVCVCKGESMPTRLAVSGRLRGGIGLDCRWRRSNSRTASPTENPPPSSRHEVLPSSTRTSTLCISAYTPRWVIKHTERILKEDIYIIRKWNS